MFPLLLVYTRGKRQEFPYTMYLYSPVENVMVPLLLVYTSGKRQRTPISFNTLVENVKDSKSHEYAREIMCLRILFLVNILLYTDVCNYSLSLNQTNMLQGCLPIL